MRTVARVILAALWSPLLAVPAYAHHSFGQFDDKRCMSIEGTVKEFEFVQKVPILFEVGCAANIRDNGTSFDLTPPEED